MLEFMARKRAKLRGRLNLLFLLAHSRVLQAVTPPLCGCVCAAQTDTDSRKINLPFSLACPRVLQRHIAAVRESCRQSCRTFFARTKKGAKKVHGGLASPLDSRGRRQIFKI